MKPQNHSGVESVVGCSTMQGPWPTELRRTDGRRRRLGVKNLKKGEINGKATETARIF